MGAKIEVRVSHRFGAPPERVYDAWLRPDTIRRWMTAALAAMGLDADVRQVRVDARVGGSFLFSDRRGEVEARHWGEYRELDRPRRIVFTWITDESEEDDPSEVTLELEPDGDGCLVTLVHRMDEAWRDYVEQTESGWSHILAAIDSSQS